MNRNIALRLAGVLAILTAIYHGVVGDTILQTLAISPADQIGFVRSTYQLGTMGWLAGGVLLLAAATLRSQPARNWIVGVLVMMYGFPAFGTLALSDGNPGIGGIALSLVVILALVGRRSPIIEPGPELAVGHA